MCAWVAATKPRWGCDYSTTLGGQSLVEQINNATMYYYTNSLRDN